MKIIFVTREGYELPGGRIRSYNFARELASRGLMTEVLSYSDHLGAKSGKEEREMSFFQKTSCNIKAYRRLSKEKNSVIILNRVNYHSFGPLLASLTKKNHIVFDMDDWEIREDPHYILGFYPTSKAEFLTRKIARMSDFCLASSLYLKEFLSRSNKKTYYVPSCVDTEKFAPLESGQIKERIKFCWVGTIHRREDIENIKFIVDCFRSVKADHKNIEFHIAGDGVYGVALKDHLSLIGDSFDIFFRGHIQADEVPEFLNDMDVGLFPLIRDTKFNKSKSPTKLFEYMAMEKIAIASGVGESLAILEDGIDGFLAYSKDDFTDKMRFVINNKSHLVQVRKKAREKVLKAYSLKIAGDALCSLIKENYGF